MSNKQRDNNKHIEGVICPPFNSIHAWVQFVWQVFSAIVSFVVLIDMWNTNCALLFFLMLFGGLVSIVFFIWTIAYDGQNKTPFKDLLSISSMDQRCTEGKHYINWVYDQPVYF